VNRVVFVAAGKIAEEASPDGFCDTPRCDRAKGFLSKILHH
jgi:ABC-type polar amino acid transport system ATPase subunit